jgi:hypothetical protein
MPDQLPERRETNLTLTQAGMPVLMAAEAVQTVI